MQTPGFAALSEHCWSEVHGAQAFFTQIGFWPPRLDFGAYARGWKTSTEYTFATYFLNSFLITLPRIAVTVVSCVLVAYAFARFEFWGKRWLFAVMVGTMMLPVIIAASSMSRGMPRRNCTSMKTKKVSVANADGRMSGQ